MLVTVLFTWLRSAKQPEDPSAAQSLNNVELVCRLDLLGSGLSQPSLVRHSPAPPMAYLIILE